MAVDRSRRHAPLMEHVEKSVDVNVPLRTCYDQWTQFEDFPEFMPGVHEVKQLDATHLHWKADIFGRTVEWEAEITEQEVDKRISWKSLSGSKSAGTVRFEPLDEDRTRVRLVMAYEPQGPVENAGNAMGLVGVHVQRAVDEFKRFIETRGEATGSWRGDVKDGEVRPRL